MKNLIRKILKEDFGGEFDWVVDHMRQRPLDGVKFRTQLGGGPLTVNDDGTTYIYVSWIDSDGELQQSSSYHRGTVKNFLENGTWTIIKESVNEDFNWVQDVDDEKALRNMSHNWQEIAAQVYTGFEWYYDDAGEPIEDEDGDIKKRELSNEEIEDKRQLLEWYLVNHYFRGLKEKGGRYYMEVDHWSDFAEMFKDCDSQYSMCRGLARQVLAEDDYWEPYYDVTQDWYDEVWTLVNKKTYDEIINHIREKYVGDSMSGNRTITLDGEEVELTEELLDSWIGDSDVLGKIIEDVPEFEDIKTSLEHSYESAYNTSARDNVWKAAKNAITDLFGEGEWVSYEVKKMDGTVTRHELVFDVTSIVPEIIDAYFQEYCDLEYDRECDFEYSDFFDLVKFMMYEEIWNEEFNPTFDEYPNDDDVYMYFNDDASERLHW